MIVMPNGLPASAEPKLLLPRIRKYRDRRIEMRGMRFGVEGFFRLECVYPYLGGISRWLTPMFHNHITNVGLDMYATTSNRLSACRVGNGTAEPTDEDTTLESFVAGTTSRVNGADHNTGNTSSPPYWRQAHFVYTFSIGAIVGNITEISVGPAPATAGTNSFSRELIRDEEAAPTSISLNSEQQLRAHYWLRHYAPVADNEGNVDITLDGVPTSHAFVRRAAGAGGSAWNVGPTESVLFGVNTASNALASGALAAATAQPSGLKGMTSKDVSAYTPGSYARSAALYWGINEGNGTSPVVRVTLGSQGGMANFQIGLTPSIEKDNTKTLTLNFNAAWGRYSP